MSRYIVISALVHVGLIATMFLLSLFWPLEQEPLMIRLNPMLLPPPPESQEATPTAQATPTRMATLKPTTVRQMVGEDLPTATYTPTPTFTRKATSTPTPSRTASPTRTPKENTATPTQTRTRKPDPTSTQTRKPSATASRTRTPAPTRTPQPTKSPTPNQRATQVAAAAQNLARAISKAEQPTPPERNLSLGENFYSHSGSALRTSIPFRDASYLNRLFMALQEKFVPPLAARERGARKVLVYFRIIGNGGITDVQVISSSGHKRIDAAAMQAVEQIRPFEPLPGGVEDLGITCEFVVN